MNVRLLLPEEILQRWSEISPLIQEALDTGQGENTLVDYMKKLMSLQVHCWLNTDNENKILGVCLTEFIQYTRHKTLHIIALTGTDFESWSNFGYSKIEQFAKDGGATVVEVWGRKGWVKALPKMDSGFEQVYVVMRKNIGEE